MHRRRFLNALSGSAAACAVSDGTARAAVTPSASSRLGVTPVRPNDDQSYFSEERLRAVIDTSLPIEGLACETVAYHFPAWHVTPFMEERFGKGWTELEMLKRSRPLYPGHLFPKYPLWTDFNEADPEGAAREIDLAADFGVDVWMVDWYWHDGIMLYHEQLEEGFLKASNRSRLKFAVMWANHDWKNIYPASSPAASSVMLPQRHSEDDMRRIEHYFSQPNYWRIGRLPVFAIFDLRRMVETFGVAGLRRVLDEMRERAARAGLGGLHIQASHVYDPSQLVDVGIDSATRYHTFGYSYTRQGRPAGERTPYGEAAFDRRSGSTGPLRHRRGEPPRPCRSANSSSRAPSGYTITTVPIWPRRRRSGSPVWKSFTDVSSSHKIVVTQLTTHRLQNMAVVRRGKSSPCRTTQAVPTIAAPFSVRIET